MLACAFSFSPWSRGIQVTERQHLLLPQPRPLICPSDEDSSTNHPYMSAVGCVVLQPGPLVHSTCIINYWLDPWEWGPSSSPLHSAVS